VKWRVEDSHGPERTHKGHYAMYNDWFDEYLFVVVIRKKYLPQEVWNIFQQTPVSLPLWDPMVSILQNAVEK
jgi:bleomycin hydrolase